jgi:hypothetical protein
MKMADGGFRPAYDVQFATDTKSAAIAGVSVDNIGSDMGKMAPMNDALAEQYGERPGQHLADGGFAKLEDIEALSKKGVETFVPVPKPRDASRDRHGPHAGDSQGVADWRKRMGEDEAKEVYKERAATAECANAQARNRGLTQFLVRGLEKVKTIPLWCRRRRGSAHRWRVFVAHVMVVGRACRSGRHRGVAGQPDGAFGWVLPRAGRCASAARFVTVGGAADICRSVSEGSSLWSPAASARVRTGDRRRDRRRRL